MKAILTLSLTLTAGSLLAQDATLSAPVAVPAETKLAIIGYSENYRTNAIELNVAYRSADNVDRRVVRFDYRDDPATGANEFNAWLNCVNAAAAGETGTAERKRKFRLLTCASSVGILPAVSTVTP